MPGSGFDGGRFDGGRFDRRTLLAGMPGLVLLAGGCGSGRDQDQGAGGRDHPSPPGTASGTPTSPSSGPAASSSASPTASSVPPSASSRSPSASSSTPARPAHAPIPRVTDTIATGLTTPWDLAFLPDRSALVTERDTARVLRIAPSGSLRRVGTVPGVVHAGEGGLLGLTLSPSYRSDHLLYAYLTTADDNRVVRMRYRRGSLGQPRAILTGIPRGALHHDGGRLRFGPDGMLYVSTGDAYDKSNAQDKHSLGGKILRITPSGTPAPGNPDPSSPIWTLGHRNVEGLAFDRDGRLWASEFGDKKADELNLIRRGGNYGWPIVEGTGGVGQGYVDPKVTWAVADACPSGIGYTTGTIWLAGLRGERLWRVRVRGSRTVGAPKAFFTSEYGRLRAVQPAPDGSLWLATSNTDGRTSPRPGDDRILRLALT